MVFRGKNQTLFDAIHVGKDNKMIEPPTTIEGIFIEDIKPNNEIPNPTIAIAIAITRMPKTF